MDDGTVPDAKVTNHANDDDEENNQLAFLRDFHDNRYKQTLACTSRFSGIYRKT
jgi:hypothetical protein